MCSSSMDSSLMPLVAARSAMGELVKGVIWTPKSALPSFTASQMS